MARNRYRIPDQKSVTYGYSAEVIAAICGVGLRTACRWKSGATEMPAASKMLLAGDLGCLSEEWTGWRISNGLLISPEGWRASVGDVMCIQLTQLQLGDYRRENRALRQALAEMTCEAQPIPDEQPLPDQWEIAAG